MTLRAFFVSQALCGAAQRLFGAFWLGCQSLLATFGAET